jgi:TatD DNase family protein
MWFDSHCHLDFDAFDGDREDVWARACAAGVTQVFVPGATPAQWAGLGALKARFSGVHVGVGLHPYFLHEVGEQECERALERLPAEYARLGASAVGECGLDGRPEKVEHTPLERQVAVLERHLVLARELAAPLVVHVVHAHGVAVRLFEKFGPLPAGGVLHSYSGSAAFVPRYARLGFSFGFSAAVCRTGARKVLEAVRAVRDDRLLLETDAPDQLSPALRHAGAVRNEPTALLDVAKVVSECRGVSLAHLAALTTANAERLFSGLVSSEPLR